MIKNKFLHKRFIQVVVFCVALSLVACSPQNVIVEETESEEIVIIETEGFEYTEAATEDEDYEIATESGVDYEDEALKYVIAKLEKNMYATTTVNIRKGPDTTYEKLGTLIMNQEVKVTGICNENDWYRVEYNDGIGFVSGEYLSDKKVPSWVADLDVAETANQIIVVAADGSNATVSMHNKEDDGTWTEILSTDGKIGRNGIGKAKEGDGKTPTGVYRFMFGFGNMSDPGCGLNYTQVDDSYYWVDDSDSAYYNQFVTTNEVAKDWDSAEHIAGVKSSYNYVLALDYNVDCVPEKGSAIFMHCTPTGGAGCIAVSEDMMLEIMQNVKDGCVVVIDSVEGVMEY